MHENTDTLADTLASIGVKIEAGAVIIPDVVGTEIVERDHYCPGTVPCLGRTGVLVAVPIRLESDARRKIAEARFVRCAGCGTNGPVDMRVA